VEHIPDVEGSSLVRSQVGAERHREDDVSRGTRRGARR
jgi:hypothetical protein